MLTPSQYRCYVSFQQVPVFAVVNVSVGLAFQLLRRNCFVGIALGMRSTPWATSSEHWASAGEMRLTGTSCPVLPFLLRPILPGRQPEKLAVPIIKVLNAS